MHIFSSFLLVVSGRSAVQLPRLVDRFYSAAMEEYLEAQSWLSIPSTSNCKIMVVATESE